MEKIYSKVNPDKLLHLIQRVDEIKKCDVHEIPLATNYRSAHILIKYFKGK